MVERPSIFNFVSNSYTKFLLPYCSLQTEKLESENNKFSSFEIYMHLYKVKKNQSKLYKLIFSILGLVFFFLAAIVYFNTTNWACSLYFQNCAFIKASIYTLCFFLSIIAFGFSYSIFPEKETARYLQNRMIKSLKDSYNRHKMELGLILHEDAKKKRAYFRQNYLLTLEKMKDHKQNAFYILEKIVYSKKDYATKNQMITQSLFDLQNALNAALQVFKQKNYLLTMHTGS